MDVDVNNSTTLGKVKVIMLKGEQGAAGVSDFVTPKMYGAEGDGITDDTAAIQSAIANNPESTIHFTAGTYLISDTITGVQGIHFLLDPDAEIKLTDTVQVMIHNDIVLSTGDPDARDRRSFIEGGTINGDGKCDYIYGYNYCIGCKVENVVLKNFKKAAIHTLFNTDGTETGVCASNLHSDLYIMNETNVADSIGIYNLGSDNYFDNISIVDCQIGIWSRGGNKFNNVHPWIHKPMFAGSIAFKLTSYNMLENCTCDNMQTGILLFDHGSITSAMVYLTNHRFDWLDTVLDAATVTDAGGVTLFASTSSNPKIVGSNIFIQCGLPSIASQFKLVDNGLYALKNYFNVVKLRNVIGTNAVPSFSNYVDGDEYFNKGKPLESGDDLDDFVYPGLFYSPSSAISGTLDNVPSGYTSAALTLRVFQNASTIWQEVRINTTAFYASGIAMRIKDGNGWLEWRKLACVTQE